MNIGDDANRLATDARARVLIDRQLIPVRQAPVEVDAAAALESSSADS